MGSINNKVVLGSIGYTICHTGLSDAILTSVLPTLSPLNKLTKAFGAFSKPSKIFSFHFILPSLIHFDIEELNSFMMSI
jgi:hypothetical protein